MGCGKKLVRSLPGLGEAFRGFRPDLCENRPVGDCSYVCAPRACRLHLARNGQLRTGTDQRNPTV